MALDILTYIDTYAYPYYGAAIDEGLGLVFIASSEEGLRSFSYISTGVLTPIDSDYYGGGQYLGVCIDTTNRRLFVTQNNEGVHSYTYDTSGNLTLVSTQTSSKSAWGIKIDTTRSLLFVSDYFDGLDTYSYDGSGIITPVDNHDPGGGHRSVAIDTSKSLVFLSAGTEGLNSYSYTAGGDLTHIEKLDLADVSYVDIDTDNNIIFCGHGTNGVYSYRYTDAGGLSNLDSVNYLSATCYGISVHRSNKLIAVATTTGIHVYQYNTSGILTIEDSHIGLVSEGYRVNFVGYEIVIFGSEADGILSFAANLLEKLIGPPSMACFMPVNEDEMMILNKHAPDIGESKLGITEFQGNYTAGEYLYADILFDF